MTYFTSHGHLRLPATTRIAAPPSVNAQREIFMVRRRWYDRGERNKAGELLAPVYNWFSEGLQTLDLKQAKGLLDELA